MKFSNLIVCGGRDPSDARQHNEGIDPASSQGAGRQHRKKDQDQCDDSKPTAGGCLDAKDLNLQEINGIFHGAPLSKRHRGVLPAAAYCQD
jgi:hypothetical protein